MPNWKDWRWWGKGRPPCRCPSSSPTPPQQAEAFGFILQVATYGVGGWLAPHFDTYRLPGEEVRHGRWNHHHRHHNHPDHQPPPEARWGQRGMGWHSDGISHLSRAGRTHCLSKVHHCDISMLKKLISQNIDIYINISPWWLGGAPSPPSSSSNWKSQAGFKSGACSRELDSLANHR